jgi:nicotinamidase-related amidase
MLYVGSVHGPPIGRTTTTTALIIVGLQMLMQQRIEAVRDCVHPDAASRVAALARTSRRLCWPVFHVRHRDDDPSSAPHSDVVSHRPMPGAHAEGDGPALFKRTSSALASTDLDRHLPGAGIADLTVTAPSPGSA